jgi:hypothetical protein
MVGVPESKVVGLKERFLEFVPVQRVSLVFRTRLAEAFPTYYLIESITSVQAVSLCSLQMVLTMFILYVVIFPLFTTA